MRNLFGFGLCGFLFYVGAAESAPTTVEEEVDRLTITGSVQQLYDSNYARTPEKSPEQITQPSLGVSINEIWSNQKLSANWRGTRYIFEELSDSSASLQTGAIDWQSLWPRGFQSSLSFKQEGYLVDPLEFMGIDVSTRNLVVARVGHGFSDGWTFNLGARGLRQLHSNPARDRLEYGETDGFAEIGYVTPAGSSVITRIRNGERNYRDEVVAIEDLNYEYTQAEVETKWVLSSKTDIAFLLAEYNRTGTINDGSGTLTSFEINWVPTEKLEFTSVYSLQQPAVGENDQGIDRVQSTFGSVQWQLTPKLALATSLSYARSHYVSFGVLLERSEGLFNYSPLSISYSPTDHWQVRFNTSWRKNFSTLDYRQYTSGQATIGVFFDY